MALSVAMAYAIRLRTVMMVTIWTMMAATLNAEWRQAGCAWII